jgi:hypothetical protein
LTWSIVSELSIVHLSDPGVPNAERIALRPTQAVNLEDYLLLIGLRPEGMGLIPQHAYYFGPKIVQPPSWVLVYTGTGTNRSEVAANGEVLHLFFMNRPQVLLGKGIAAGIVRIAAVSQSEPVK